MTREKNKNDITKKLFCLIEDYNVDLRRVSATLQDIHRRLTRREVDDQGVSRDVNRYADVLQEMEHRLMGIDGRMKQIVHLLLRLSRKEKKEERRKK